jgi:hypothetical protein
MYMVTIMSSDVPAVGENEGIIQKGKKKVEKPSKSQVQQVLTKAR